MWSGTFGSAGGPASLLSVTVRQIDRQHLDSGAGEWVTDPSETAGFSGRLVHGFDAVPAGA